MIDDGLLLRIQQRQFSDKHGAERMLLEFVRKIFPLDVTAVELRPSAVSLNSFNGFLALADGRNLFFKTHTEQDSVVREFYNAEILARAGYPMVQPLYSSAVAGRQFLIYEKVSDPTVFDVAWQIECGHDDLAGVLTAAQHRADRELLNLYVRTAEMQPAASAASAPVHQLFYHRLTGRLLRDSYARTSVFVLPDGDFSMGGLRRRTWVINGQRYADTLDGLIGRGVQLLNPAQDGSSVVGHGDAHNGNVFLRLNESRLIYFDPAFGGRHSPILDLAKPIFHNTFAMWMYFPEIKSGSLELSWHVAGNEIHVDHNYRPGSIRHMFLDSKINNVLMPILTELRRRGLLEPRWREQFKAALFCCALLTKDLSDRSLFPADIGLLGLAFAVEMGAESSGERSLIDQELDRAAEQLRQGS
jgi:hypothetical protein